MKPLKFAFILILTSTFFGFTAGEKPSSSVKSFLNWYAQNQERLNKIDLVLNYSKSTATGNGKNYDVDYKAVEKYLTEIKKSGFIGPKFIEKWREYFKNCEASFKSKPQNSGIPTGFENDIIVLSNNFDFTNLEKAEVKTETIKSNSYALVIMKFFNGSHLTFELGKQNNIWLIQSILN